MGNLLENKVAVITGAGRGIGKAIAIAYAANGAKVCNIDIDIFRQTLYGCNHNYNYIGFA